MAQGFIEKTQPNAKRVSIGFDFDLFDDINAEAKSNGFSFAKQVRLLSEWGLEAVETAKKEENTTCF